jgi:hypothetical protein
MSKPLQYQIIARALELVSDENTWAKGAMARRADGMPCAPMHPRAVRFCAVGALQRAAGELSGGDQAFQRAEQAETCVLTTNRSRVELPAINDLAGRQAIVDMFRVALAS